jgi:hypothetical protein
MIQKKLFLLFIPVLNSLFKDKKFGTTIKKIPGKNGKVSDGLRTGYPRANQPWPNKENKKLN